MKTIIIISALSILLLCSACNTTKFVTIHPDGTKTEFLNSRLIWKTQPYKMTIGTNGVATIDCKGSGPDADVIKAAVQGAVEGMK